MEKLLNQKKLKIKNGRYRSVSFESLVLRHLMITLVRNTKKLSSYENIKNKQEKDGKKGCREAPLLPPLETATEGLYLLQFTK